MINLFPLITLLAFSISSYGQSYPSPVASHVKIEVKTDFFNENSWDRYPFLEHLRLYCPKYTKIKKLSLQSIRNLKSFSSSGNCDYSDIEGLFQNLPNLINLTIDSPLNLTEATILGTAAIMDLSIRNVASISDTFFDNLPQLRKLAFSNVQKIPDLDRIPKLLHLRFYDCGIQKLDKNLLKNMRNLRIFSAYNNKFLTKIEDHVFQYAENLLMMQIGDSPLQTLKRVTLEGLTNLEMLSLSNTEISNIEPGALRQLTSLKSGFVSSSKLTEEDIQLLKEELPAQPHF